MTTSVSNFSFSAFQAKYKFRVGGIEDALLRSVGSLLKGDETAFRMLKSSRTNEFHRIKALETSEPDPNLRLAAAAKEKLSFLQKSAQLIGKASLDNTAKAKTMAPILSKTASELKTMILDYTANTADSPEDQAAFLNKAQALVDKLQRVVLQQKGKLRAEGQIYNASMVAAVRHLAEAEAAISTHLGGGAMVAGGGVDITV